MGSQTSTLKHSLTFFSLAQHPNAGEVRRILDDSGPHKMTPHSP